MENAAQFARVVTVEVAAAADGAVAVELVAANAGVDVNRIEADVAVAVGADASADGTVAEIDVEIGIGDFGCAVATDNGFTVVAGAAAGRHIFGKRALAEDVVGAAVGNVTEAAVTVAVAADEEVFVADAVNRRAVARLDVRHAAGDDADLARRQAFAVNVQGIEVVAVQRLQVAAVGAIATVT